MSEFTSLDRIPQRNDCSTNVNSFGYSISVGKQVAKYLSTFTSTARVKNNQRLKSSIIRFREWRQWD